MTCILLVSNMIRTIKFNKSEIKKVSDYTHEEKYGVSTSNKIATQVGMDILEKGGNAVDAAIAISYVLGVVEPYASGIGGGGGMLVYSPKDKNYRFFDYREVAPSDSKINNIGIPGFVRGMEYIHNIYGSMNIKELMQPAIDYAENGFKLDTYGLNRFKSSKMKIKNRSELNQFYINDQPFTLGSIIKQKELANSLKEIQANGAEAFYTGSLSYKIIEKTGWSRVDLANYKVIEREPIKINFKGYDVVSAPAPFGGITLAQILKLYEYSPVPNYKTNKLEYIEKISNIVDRAYSDRINTIADPKYNKKNYSELVKDDYIANLYNKESFEDNEDNDEHESTTHFVVIDKNGMTVSTTNTISNFFGSGEYVEGFFLNDTLSQFNYTNKKSINKYEVGKRPRTFMSPTILTKGNEYIMGIGSPGGNRISQLIAQIIIKTLDHGYDLHEAIEESRVAFGRNNKITIESDMNKTLKSNLLENGYNIKLNTSSLYYGSVHAIVYDESISKKMYGGADSRRNGSWMVNTR